MGFISVKLVNVDIAALMDLRLGALLYIGEKAGLGADLAVSITSKPSYFMRQSDTFTLASGEKLAAKDIYQVIQKHPVEVLERSMITHLPFLMLEFALKHRRNNGLTPQACHIRFSINFYPLTLPDAVKQKICDIVYNKMQRQFNVSACYKPPEVMTPAHLKEHYVGSFIYDWSIWVDTHAEAFKLLSPNNHIQFFAAKLRQIDDAKKLEKGKKIFEAKKIDEWEFLTQSMAFILPIDFFNAGLASAAVPLNDIKQHMPKHAS